MLNAKVLNATIASLIAYELFKYTCVKCPSSRTNSDSNAQGLFKTTRSISNLRIMFQIVLEKQVHLVQASFVEVVHLAYIYNVGSIYPSFGCFITNFNLPTSA